MTRFAPSPTGDVHLGGILVSLISQSVAHFSGGVFILRVEDTDRKRYVEGAVDQLLGALRYFDIQPDELPSIGSYGPYHQSKRKHIYDSYVMHLLRNDRAYPCFCAKDELAAIKSIQRNEGKMTGYWGKWARCRDIAEFDVIQQIDTGKPYVIRFRAPEFAGKRVQYTDLIRGPLTIEDNRQDVVIRKTGGLPTYHFAHPVDDHLMRVTKVIRGDEWLSSVPLHLQLFEALGFPVPDYAHIAPLMITEGRSRRKLSKRKDPEANVDYYKRLGYPHEGVLVYVKGLANSRLLDSPPIEVLGTPLFLEDCSRSGQLVDLVKLEHICKEVISEMSPIDVSARILKWAESFDPALAEIVNRESKFVMNALTIQLMPPTGPRKELAKWSDFREKCSFMVPSLFKPITDSSDERFSPLNPSSVISLAQKIANHYQHDVGPDEWFAQIRDSAVGLGFAAKMGNYKRNPQDYSGSIKDAANVVRVLLTGQIRSPELHHVAQALGKVEVLNRLTSLTD